MQTKEKHKHILHKTETTYLGENFTGMRFHFRRFKTNISSVDLVKNFVFYIP